MKLLESVLRTRSANRRIYMNKKTINFKMIGLSLIFLFNPNVNIIDFLPDFIGYILLCIALTSLADMNETIAEAHGMFKKLILIDAAKILAWLWVFGISVVSEKNSSLMLWSFAFGVAELVFVIPAFLKLFKGIADLGYLHDNTSVIGSKRMGSKKSYTDKARNTTVVFIFLKAIMSFLPELADLTSTEYSENIGLMNMYRYIGIMRFLAFLPVFAVGVYWIIRCVKYFYRISNDIEFISELEKTYAQRVAPRQGIFVRRNIALSFAVLLAAMLFSVDFRMERVNMLPDFVSGILLVAFFVIASRKTKIDRGFPIFMGCVYALVGAFAYISEFWFFGNYSYSAIDRSTQAKGAFTVLASVSTLSTILFVLITFIALNAVKRIIFEHTGMLSTTDNAASQEKISQSIRSELGKTVIICGVMAVIYAFTDIFYIFFAKEFSFAFTVNLIGAIAFAISFMTLYHDVSEAVRSRYILE